MLPPPTPPFEFSCPNLRQVLCSFFAEKCWKVYILYCNLFRRAPSAKKWISPPTWTQSFVLILRQKVPSISSFLLQVFSRKLGEEEEGAYGTSGTSPPPPSEFCPQNRCKVLCSFCAGKSHQFWVLYSNPFQENWRVGNWDRPPALFLSLIHISEPTRPY